ncbi:flavin-containing amine oxidoreductase [Dioszegia hungarica]|uniref:Flavin-containing amine oxidoreductase n=1 Tax=Dioszegia hungarica TaxID=4972 RepID=A0AA38H2B6_9TREE|nr:flavin-containing amine oxidoreductase [Dioszegia hungarica]KAI9632540.1 flavin-containing amine oxidoreductase [Dioszegia hungarica]
MRKMTQLYDTIILGAGWSGAVAAQSLAGKGHKVLVLEARDRVGGRAQTWVGGGAKVDVGCSWIHGYREGNPTRGIAKSLGVDAHLPKPADGVIYGPNGMRLLSKEETASLRANLSAAQASLKTPHPAPSPTASLASGLFASLSPLFKGGKPASKPEDTNLAQDFARMLEVPLGVKLEKASLKWAGWETSTNFAGSDAAPEGGYEALVGKVLADAKSKGAEVKLSSKVEKVEDGSESATVTAGGSTYTARTILSTIPLGVLKKLSSDFFSPALPPALQETIKGTHVGVLEKLLLQYPSAWWPEAEKIGSYTFLPTGPTPTPNSSLQEVFDGSTIMCANFAAPSLPGPTPTLLSYLSETPATLLLKHDPKDVAEAYHQFLISRFKPSTPPPSPSNSNLTNWLTDEYSHGATTTPSIVSDGERSPMDFKELGRPVWSGRLGFAGEHTDMDHRGSVAGAVVSGQREADRIDRFLARLDDEA